MHPEVGKPNRISGKCLCGAVVFEGIADKPDVAACHCGQCRAWSGHYWASINVPFEALKIKTGDDSLIWYRSSDYARRGFCSKCGSALFWHADKLDDHKHRIAVAVGALAAPTGAKLERHIFVADKGDYYDLADGVQQFETY
ncbi:MAG: GFA family protein [Pseudomonadota bacterium]|nr:GFA family protein [Pseudomonadota bacterium]